MFDLFRSREKSVRILLGVLLGLVALSMLVYLIPGGPGSGGPTGQNTVAMVGDEKITTVDVQRAIQRVTQGRTNLPKGILAMYIPSIVNQLIEAKAMAYKARELGLTISDQELGDAIQAEFSGALGGKFDMSIYQSILAQQGMTVPGYEQERRDAMLGMRLEQTESQSVIVTDTDARAEYSRKNLKIGLQYIDFEGKDFTSKVKAEPAAIKTYFDKNRALFRIPEKRDLALVVGSTLPFLQTAKISDDDLQKQYQENIDSYRVPERVKVRHILIKTQGKPKDQAPQLKAKAEDILKQLKGGADFADLAKKFSEDPGSGAKGGELDWIVRGQTVPNFEKTAFSLKPGELSGLVETEYGYHIIQVEDKQAAHTQTFDEVKPQLLAQAQKEAAAQALKNAVDAAHSEIARNPGQAEAIAKKYTLGFYKLNGFSSSDNLPDISNQPELSNAIFTGAKGSTTDIVNIEAQNKEAFATILNITQAHNAEFADVQKDVEQRYMTAESLRLSQEAAKAAAARAQKGESLDAIAKDYGLTVKTAAPFTIDGAAEGIGAGSLFQSAFKSDVGAVVGPIAAQSGQFVCKISEKVPADMGQFAKSKDDIVQNLTTQRQQLVQPLFRASVVDDLKKRGKIKLNQAAITRMVGAYQS